VKHAFTLKGAGNNKVNIRLFPDQFLQHNGSGLSKLEDFGELNLPVIIEGDAGIFFISFTLTLTISPKMVTCSSPSTGALNHCRGICPPPILTLFAELR
jgi:hypothetical protein